MDETNEMVHLKYNCTPIMMNTVTAIMMNLKDLFKTKPIAFYELVMKCRDSDHVIFSRVIEGELISRDLLLPDGTTNNVIKEVVLSSTSGDGAEMCLVSPILG